MQRIEVLFTEEEVNRRIAQIGAQISKDYEGKSIHMICVLKAEHHSCVNLPRE